MGQVMGKTGWPLLVLAALLGFLWIGTWQEPALPTAQFTPPTTQHETVTATVSELELPHVIRDTGLIIEKTVCYEGDFWEDGSDTPAVDIMALVVCNPGNEGVRGAEILVRQGQRQLSFVITYLPPGSRVLVLEQLRNAYSSEPLTECRCGFLDRGSWETPGPVQVESAGIRDLAVKNNGAEDLQAVTLRYKRYNAEEELYMGGISYQLTMEPLAAGESIQVTPARYVEGSYKIVLVETH